MASWARESPQVGSTGKTRDCEGSVWLGAGTHSGLEARGHYFKGQSQRQQVQGVKQGLRLTHTSVLSNVVSTVSLRHQLPWGSGDARLTAGVQEGKSLAQAKSCYNTERPGEGLVLQDPGQGEFYKKTAEDSKNKWHGFACYWNDPEGRERLGAGRRDGIGAGAEGQSPVWREGSVHPCNKKEGGVTGTDADSA